MRARIREFNAEAGHDLIAIKLGPHTGACLAVTPGDEIVVTDDVLSVPGAAARFG
jgi:hypothetical protein